MFGAPIDVTGDAITEELAKREIHKPLKVHRFDKSKQVSNFKDDDFGNNCVYTSLKFEVPISVDKLLEQEVSISGKNVLIIPKVDSMPVKKLVPYHQILVTFSTFVPGLNLLNPSNYSQEIPRLFSFFEKYGKIVDLNLEYMPACFVVTFSRHQSVLDLLSKSKPPLTLCRKV